MRVEDLSSFQGVNICTSRKVDFVFLYWAASPYLPYVGQKFCSLYFNILLSDAQEQKCKRYLCRIHQSNQRKNGTENIAGISVLHSWSRGSSCVWSISWNLWIACSGFIFMCQFEHVPGILDQAGRILVLSILLSGTSHISICLSVGFGLTTGDHLDTFHSAPCSTN